MSLGEHLVELRKRLMIAAIAIVLAMVLGWILSDYVWEVLRQPILQLADDGRNAQINYGDVTSAFDLRLQIALFLGALIACPVWLYQIWAFLAPGLTRREKTYGVVFLGTAVPLFLTGAYVAWLLLPNIVRLLSSFAPPEDAAFYNARNYLDLALKLMLAVGVGFVLPVFLVLLNFLGVISAKAILKNWRIAILIIILFAAITTPAADLMSMFLLAVPMIGLYFIAALIAWLHDRRKHKREGDMFAEYGIDPNEPLPTED